MFSLSLKVKEGRELTIGARIQTNTADEEPLFIRGSCNEDWYIGSSLNEKLCAEGSWEKWVVLAREILEEDQRRKRLGYKTKHIIF